MMPVDATQFSSADDLHRWCGILGSSGLRSTGSAAHSTVTDWLIDELGSVPGVDVRTTTFPVYRWEPLPEGNLEFAAGLTVGEESARVVVPVAGAVPYSATTDDRVVSAPLVHLPHTEALNAANSSGKLILRDVVPPRVPMEMLRALSFDLSEDLNALESDSVFDRPFLAPLHEDLIAAGVAGAAGVVFAFAVHRDDVAGYFDPHNGTHYRIPAVFVGRDERRLLHDAAESGRIAEISVSARVLPGSARNIHATLPGTTRKRIVVVSHTDGATFVQENGPAAILALARYFAAIPTVQRRYTIEFVLTSGHLHMSKEGSYAYADLLDNEYDTGSVALVIALEHLGARELLPSGDGRLHFTGRGELLLWAVGPSEVMRREASTAAHRRKLDNTLLAPGFGAPKRGHVPEFASFGGIGSYYHSALVPTMALVSGPWSLWAPSFGESAVDYDRMRHQVLAVADAIVALDSASPDEIAGDYKDNRRSRAAGAPRSRDTLPPEHAPGIAESQQ